jgi:hypothetical protein
VHIGKEFAGALEGRTLGEGQMLHQGLGDVAPDRQSGVQGGERILKHRTDMPTQQSPSLTHGELSEIAPFKDDLAADVAAGAQQIKDGAGDRAR